MATITDFKDFISGADLEDYNEVYCLFRAVKDIDDFGAFECKVRTTTKGNMYFVKCDHIDDVLMLASDKARDAFLLHLEKSYAGDMDMEGWYYYKYQMEKDD